MQIPPLPPSFHYHSNVVLFAPLASDQAPQAVTSSLRAHTLQVCVRLLQNCSCGRAEMEAAADADPDIAAAIAAD